MKKWEKIISEKMSLSYRIKTHWLISHEIKQKHSPVRRWMISSSLATAGLIAFWIFFRNKINIEDTEYSLTESPVLDKEFNQNIDILMNLELLEKLDEVEKWI